MLPYTVLLTWTCDLCPASDGPLPADDAREAAEAHIRFWHNTAYVTEYKRRLGLVNPMDSMGEMAKKIRKQDT